MELARLEEHGAVTVSLPGAGGADAGARRGRDRRGRLGLHRQHPRRTSAAARPSWVLLEAFPDRVVVSVRDEGPGIPAGRLEAAVADGRLGVAESIRGRIRDLGGTAEVTTGSYGTEWELTVPADRVARMGSSRLTSGADHAHCPGAVADPARPGDPTAVGRRWRPPTHGDDARPWGAWVIGLALAWSSWFYLFGQPESLGMDARAYYEAGHQSDPYQLAPGDPFAVLYSPVFVQPMCLLAWVPWAVFMTVWLTANAVAYWWLSAPLPWRWRPCAAVVIPAVLIGNVYGVLAACFLVAVLGRTRSAAAVAPLALKKITPAGVACLWLLLCREWTRRQPGRDGSSRGHIRSPSTAPSGGLDRLLDLPLRRQSLLRPLPMLLAVVLVIRVCRGGPLWLPTDRGRPLWCDGERPRASGSSGPRSGHVKVPWRETRRSESGISTLCAYDDGRRAAAAHPGRAGGRLHQADVRALAVAVLLVTFVAVVYFRGWPQDYFSTFAWLWLFSVAWNIEGGPSIGSSSCATGRWHSPC